MRTTKKKVFWLIGVVVVILICMVISTVETEHNRVISDVAGLVAQPFQKLFVGIDNMLDYGMDYFQDMADLKKENAALRSQVVMLQSRLSEDNTVRSENERLRALVDLKERTEGHDTTAASVLAIDPSGWYSYFIIDKGTNDGLSKNCVVIDAGGVLGRIEAIGSTWARVVTILEPGTACGAEVSRTGDTGILEGDPLLDGKCKMTSLSKDVNITPGDYIITSGSGDVYPSGLIIGRIKEIREEDLSRTAIVEPTGNVKSPKEVMVIRDVETAKYTEQAE